MSLGRVPFAKPYFSEDDLTEILSTMRTVLRSGWLTSGKNVEQFEKEFAEFIGTTYAVALNSGTAALHAIMLSMGIGSGDEVIVPADTFIATANAVAYTGGRPVFADSDPGTFNVAPEDVERKVTPKTRAIITVHLAGNPSKMRELQDIASANQLILVEDCAHALGASYQGIKCGSFGIAAAFSFYATKIVTTGEGGMVTTDDREVAEKIRRIRNHGRGGYGPVENTDLGYNYRMPDFQAVIGLNQMKHLNEFLETRRRIAEEYGQRLSRIGWIRPQLVRLGNICSYYAYLVKLAKDAPISRDDLMRRLGEQGVGTSVLYYPAHAQPVYQRMYGTKSQCPVAVELGQRSLALPIYHGMTREEADFVLTQTLEAAESISEPVPG